MGENVDAHHNLDKHVLRQCNQVSKVARVAKGGVVSPLLACSCTWVPLCVHQDIQLLHLLHFYLHAPLALSLPYVRTHTHNYTQSHTITHRTHTHTHTHTSTHTHIHTHHRMRRRRMRSWVPSMTHRQADGFCWCCKCLVITANKKYFLYPFCTLSVPFLYPHHCGHVK